MYGQMTAGSWIYIGTQGILQGTFETFAAVADKKFGGTLAGTITRDRRPRRHGRRAAARRHDERRRRDLHRRATSRGSPAASSTATSTCRPTRSRTPSSCAVEARDERRAAVDRRARQRRRAAAATLLGAWRRPIDIVTDQTSAHDPLSYLPVGVAVRGLARRAPSATRPASPSDAQASMAAHVRAMVEFQDARRRGLRLRQLDPRRGPQGRLRPGVRVPRLRAGVHPAAVLRGQGPVPLGRAVGRPGRHRARPTGRSSSCSRDNERLHKWITMAGERVQFQGLPARICWLGYGERAPGRAEVQRDGGLAASSRRRS